jgi:two-component system, response regulator
VVVLTTSIDDKDMLDSYGLGANAYVQKPVSSDEFVKSAGRLGLFWTLSNRRPPAKK